jgi:uncharacterized protein YkwD
MGSRHAKVVLGAVMFAGVISLLSAAVPPEKAEARTAVKTCGGESISLKVKEKRILALHNVARAAHGLKPLCADPRLTRAARSHSREMIKKTTSPIPHTTGRALSNASSVLGTIGAFTPRTLPVEGVASENQAPPSGAG